MRISEIHSTLCKLYAIDCDVDIEKYLIAIDYQIDDIMVGNRIGGREALVIRECGEMTELGLFISPEIIEAIEGSSPLSCPDEFSCATEGVSHFIYVYNRASRGERITKLELELQGEVDKFLMLSLAAYQERRFVPPELFVMQFENHRFDPKLDESERLRYTSASELAAKFCHFLLERCFNPLRTDELLRQSRDFFRRNFSQKISRLTPSA
jgi:hypothetical protein